MAQRQPHPEAGRPPLLDASQRDEALRDLMPVVEWLTHADTAFHSGNPIAGEHCLREALRVFRAIDENSPAIKAYLRWLEQNTEFGVVVEHLTKGDNPATNAYAPLPEAIGDGQLNAGYLRLLDRPCDCNSGLPSRWFTDARNIELFRGCDACYPEKIKGYRPEVLTDPNYETSEPIEDC